MNEEHASGLLPRLRRGWRHCLNRWRSIDELDACPPSELRRITADVGVSSEDLCRLSRNPDGPSELLPRRLELLGIDAKYVRQAMPTTFRDLARVCAACQAPRRCRRDLARGDVQIGLESYCLNGPTIDILTVGTNDRKFRDTTAGGGMTWWMTRRVERQARRMHDMMDRLEVDKAALVRARQGQDYAEARTRCLTCGTSDQCLRWLDRQPRLDDAPTFCPNRRLFARFRKP
jgi:hypothetical protein